MAQAQLNQAGRGRANLDYSPRVSPMTDVVQLHSTFYMPLIGFGTWQLPVSVTAARVRDALDAGYRHIDCAASFENMPQVADAVNQWLVDRNAERADIFISAKIWNTQHSSAECEKEIVKVQKLLFNTAYIDLMLIHWPMGWQEGGSLHPLAPNGMKAASDIDYMETWRMMEKYQRKGAIRSIGFCNFNLKQAQRVWDEADVKPSVIQLELNPFCSQTEFRRFCSEKGIALCAHSPLSNPGNRFQRRREHPNLLENETIQAIGRIHGKTPVQVLLRWIIDSNLCAVVKSSDPRHIRQNINVFKFRLSPEEIARIDYLNIDLRIIDPIMGSVDHPHYPWPVSERKKK